MHTTLLTLFLLLNPASSGTESCQAQQTEDFSPFFKTFSQSKPFAIERTITPLKQVVWEYGLDENGKDASIARTVEVSAAQYKASPTLAAYMQENGLTSKTKSTTENIAVVEVFMPASDWLLSYHFVRRGNCWYLQEFQDHSL